jgi:hypothetical protein
MPCGELGRSGLVDQIDDFQIKGVKDAGALVGPWLSSTRTLTRFQHPGSVGQERNRAAQKRMLQRKSGSRGARFGGSIFTSEDHQFRALRFRGLCPAKSNLPTWRSPELAALV